MTELREDHEAQFLMSLAESQHKPFFEVAGWPAHEILRWRVWTILQNEERKKREAEARASARRR